MFDPTTMPIMPLHIPKEKGVKMRYANKQFLSNDPQDADESGSMVCALTTDLYSDLYRHSAEKPTVDGSVQVRDCYGKPVTLDFTVRSDNGLVRRLAKLDRMIEMLTEMREKLPEFYADAKANGAKWLAENPEESEDKPTTAMQQLGLDRSDE